MGVTYPVFPKKVGAVWLSSNEWKNHNFLAGFSIIGGYNPIIFKPGVIGVPKSIIPIFVGQEKTPAASR